MIIYISLAKNLKHLLECEVTKKVNNKIYFTVINGAWKGYFDLEQQIVRVEATRENVRAQIVDCGVVKGEDYNERIGNVIQYINEHGPLSQAELRKHGYISSSSQSPRCVKKRSKSNNIQTVVQQKCSHWTDRDVQKHHTACPYCKIVKLKEAVGWALEYIDAIPSDIVAKFPTMPGFDRAYVEKLLE